MNKYIGKAWQITKNKSSRTGNEYYTEVYYFLDIKEFIATVSKKR